MLFSRCLTKSVVPKQERFEEPDAEYYVHSGTGTDKGASHASTSPSGEDLEINAGSVSSTKVRSWPHTEACSHLYSPHILAHRLR